MVGHEISGLVQYDLNITIKISNLKKRAFGVFNEWLLGLSIQRTAQMQNIKFF